MPIFYIERKTGKTKEELVPGGIFLKWLYESKPGFFLLEILVKKKLFSFLYGKLQDTRLSRRKIRNFIDSQEIDMREAQVENFLSYKTFNEFFTRKLKDDSRLISRKPEVLVSPADGKISAWQTIDYEKVLQVKGNYYSLDDLFQDKNLASRYNAGTCLVIRLCPADYHRFHFPDDGTPLEFKRIGKLLYSVNPIALKGIPRLYCQNKRELTLFQSVNFGNIVMVEVGATCVGSIVQTYIPGRYVCRGEEKGYFKFGGSTVILFFEQGAVKIDEDLLLNTQKGIETKILMGERIGITGKI